MIEMQRNANYLNSPRSPSPVYRYCCQIADGAVSFSSCNTSQTAVPVVRSCGLQAAAPPLASHHRYGPMCNSWSLKITCKYEYRLFLAPQPSPLPLPYRKITK
jgi:hypothetical protein